MTSLQRSIFDMPEEAYTDYDDSDNWYTPEKYINAVRAVMGSIDTDPASSLAAQQTVQATTYYTKETNGLDKPWCGRVWLNPPYSARLITSFITKAIAEYEQGICTEAIILTNNYADTTWFHSLLSRYPVCFVRGRINFWRLGQHSVQNRWGQSFFYLGKNVQSFANVFSEFGIVVTRI